MTPEAKQKEKTGKAYSIWLFLRQPCQCSNEMLLSEGTGSESTDSVGEDPALV